MPSVSNGYCRICNAFGLLSADHVPPRGAASPKDLLTGSLLAWNKASDKLSKKTELKIKQGGIKFPSLCSKCNNERLGIEYDPELIRLSLSVARIINASTRQGLVVPDSYKFTIQPQRISRAVVGHLFAVPRFKDHSDLTKPLEHSPDGRYHPALRSFFLNQLQSWPAECKLYLWLTSARSQFIARCFAHKDIRIKGALYGEVLRFFPLGFFLSFSSEVPPYQPMTEITPLPHEEINTERNVLLSLRHRPPNEWPERLGDHEMLFFNDQAVILSRPHKRPFKKRRR